jgi:hypothetical protein
MEDTLQGTCTLEVKATFSLETSAAHITEEQNPLLEKLN